MKTDQSNATRRWLRDGQSFPTGDIRKTRVEGDECHRLAKLRLQVEAAGKLDRIA